MTTEEALLAAIWASPHDDLPRLVYADWLDENGQHGRAEFIRVQCELARMEENDPRRELLTRAEGELIRQHEAEFCPHLPDPATRIEYDRGFALPTLQLSAKRLRSRGPNFLRHAPLWAFDLGLGGESDEFAALTKTDKLIRTARLRLQLERYRRHLAEYGVWFTAAECFRNLTHLDLGTALNGAAPTDQLPEFCRASNMPLLQELAFESRGVTVDTVPHLTSAPFAPTLRTLKIDNMEQLSPDGFSLLISAPSFSNLLDLELRGFRVTDDNVYLGRFARDAALPSLKRLSLPFDVTEPEWIEPFRGWTGAASLKELNLACGTERAIRAIIGAGIFPALRRLSVRLREFAPGITRIIFGRTTEVITSNFTPRDTVTELLQFATDHGVALHLERW